MLDHRGRLLRGQGYDLQLARDDERGWRATFYASVIEHSPTSATSIGWERTPWHAAQRAAWEALKKRVTTATRALMTVSLLLLLAGCASGYLIAAPPTVPDPTRAATVIIVRPATLIGAAVTKTVRIDGVELYELGVGEHVSIRVAPGERIISLKVWDTLFPTRVYPSETIQAEAGRTYYFRVMVGGLARAADGEGQDLVKETKPVSQQPFVPPPR